ncbi:hypothetical protein CPB97_008856 [Podila verticillata]|nr:hypothetical protein CPB97_008856 [Podila verticillata]
MLRDVHSVDFAFVLTHSKKDQRSNNDRMVAFWAHQDMLALSSEKFQELHGVTQVVNTSLTDPALFLLAMDLIPEYSLVAYCVILRFIYTGVLECTVDLREFILTPMLIPDADPPFCIEDDLLEEVTMLAEQYGFEGVLRECLLHLQLEPDYQHKQL